MQIKLTPNEARILYAINSDEGSTLYELVSAARLTPTEVRQSVPRLLDMGYLEQLSENDYLKLTHKGIVVLKDISESSLSDSRLKAASSTAIVSEDEDLRDELEDMPSEEVSAALDEEIEKFM